MPGRRPKQPTREDRAIMAEEAEAKITDAAMHCGMLASEIDETNAELVKAWQELGDELQALAERAKKLAC